MIGWPHRPTRGHANLWIWSLQVLPPLCWAFQLISFLLGPGILLPSWHLWLAVGYPQFTIFHCYITLFKFLSLCTVYHPLLPYSILPSFPSPSSLPPKSLPPSTSCEYFVPPSTKDWKIHIWSSLFLSFMCSVNCILGIPSFWTNIHLSVSAYHVCYFVIGLPHSGWYFLVPSICLRIS